MMQDWLGIVFLCDVGGAGVFVCTYPLLVFICVCMCLHTHTYTHFRHLRFVHCRQRILESVNEATVGTSRRWMIKARSQPALRDAAVPVHSRQTHHEAEQRNHIDVSLLSAWRIREGVSQSDRQSSLQYISLGGIPQTILALWCCDC